jgi:trk system potassium uptake protein
MYIIIVGCGRLGSNLAMELSDYGHDICVIDRDKEKLDVLGTGFNGQKINSIEFDSANLVQSGIEQADALLALTPDDNINIMVSLIAIKIYHVPQVVARTNDPNRKYIYDKLDIETINPVQLGADLLLNRLMTKSIDIIASISDEYKIIDFIVKKQKTAVVIEEIESKYNCRISALMRGETVVFPKPDDKLNEGDKVYCIIDDPGKEKLIRLFSKEKTIWDP